MNEDFIIKTKASAPISIINQYIKREKYETPPFIINHKCSLQ